MDNFILSILELGKEPSQHFINGSAVHSISMFAPIDKKRQGVFLVCVNRVSGSTLNFEYPNEETARRSIAFLTLENINREIQTKTLK
jgi:hypothetical protein